MGGMTGYAAWRNDQSFLQQSLSVNALREVLENMILVDNPLLRYRRTLFMALPAKEWNFEGSNRGVLILYGKDAVGTMAFLAMWRQRISLRDRLAMERFGVQFLLC